MGILRSWLQERQISVRAFATATGYTYNHAAQLVRGARPISEAALGRLFVVYGPELAERLIGEVQTNQKRITC